MSDDRLLKEYVKESLKEFFWKSSDDYDDDDYLDRRYVSRQKPSWWSKLKDALGIRTKKEYQRLDNVSKAKRSVQSRRKARQLFDKWLQRLDLNIEEEEELRQSLLPAAETMYMFSLKKSNGDRAAAQEALLKFLEENYEDFLL